MAASSMSSPPPEFPSGCCLTTSGQTLPGKNDSDTQVYTCKGLVPKFKVIYATCICQHNGRGWQGHVNMLQDIVACEVL